MPLDKLLHDLFNTTGGGIFLMVIALVLRAMLPAWKWLRAAMMLTGGIVAIHPLAYVLGTLIANRDDDGLFQKYAVHGLAWAAGLIPVVGGVPHFVLDVLGTNLPWIFAAVMFIWTLIQLFPRVWVLLRKRASAAVHGRGAGERAAERDITAARGGVATATRTTKRLQGLHAARHHTTWVALLAPAAVGLVPPLAIAWNLGGL